MKFDCRSKGQVQQQAHFESNSQSNEKRDDGRLIEKHQCRPWEAFISNLAEVSGQIPIFNGYDQVKR
jgi:hypothetical protein